MEGQNATLYAYLLDKSINEQGGIWRLFHGKNKVWRKKIPKKLSELARLLGTLEHFHWHKE